jgi:hypothetical protein
LLVPPEDTQRAQSIPSAGPAITLFEFEVNRAGMSVLQQPGAIGLLFGLK